MLQEDLKEIAKFGEQLNCLVVSHANGGWVGFAENGLGVYFETATNLINVYVTIGERIRAKCTAVR